MLRRWAVVRKFAWLNSRSKCSPAKVQDTVNYFSALRRHWKALSLERALKEAMHERIGLRYLLATDLWIVRVNEHVWSLAILIAREGSKLRT